ncbi:hypothetical protein FDUTEX481_08503 [Tolypothrix sp. PCC 7601]|nr:hypothetical protein FDUTEX481_08503 [Tolypothrix sp. PCC 7601]
MVKLVLSFVIGHLLLAKLVVHHTKSDGQKTNRKGTKYTK